MFKASLAVLLGTISNFTGIFAKKLFFSKNVSVHAIFNDQSFNDTLTNASLALNNWAKEIICCEYSLEAVVTIITAYIFGRNEKKVSRYSSCLELCSELPSRNAAVKSK